MTKDIIALTKKFISIQSIPSQPEALSNILELALTELSGYTIERFSKNGVKSALVYNAPTRPKKFKILLNAHLDVIPGKEHQYIPKIKGTKLYGVGAMDMKANVACLIAAFHDIASQVNYPLALQLTTDEEIGGFDGTKHQIENGVRADLVLAGEPTNFDIVTKTKGVLWVKVTAKGKTAHGAYPWRGDNAIWKIHEFLATIKKQFPLPKHEVWKTTINLSKISTSNTALNKIPDDCIAELDIRYVPEDSKTIVKKIRSLLPKGVSMEIIANEPGSFIDENNNYVKLLKKIGKEITGKKIVLRGAQGSSDARHFTPVGGSGIEFGPIGGGIGSDDEWVDIASLEKYKVIISEFLLSVEKS